MAKYILLEDVTGAASAHSAGDTAIRLRPAGGAGDREIVLSEPNLDEQDVAEARRSPRTLGLCPEMPVRLIAPTEMSDDEDAASKDPPAPTPIPTWGIEAVGAPAAHAAGITGAGVTVAVLDTGIDASHPAFAHLKPTQRDFIDSQAPAGLAVDAHGHGTHCAGTIFGRHPRQAIAVAPGVTDVLIGRVLGAKGSGSSAAVFQGLQWAQQQGAQVISMSLGFDFPGLAAKLQNDGWPPDLAASTALEAYRQNLRVFDRLMSFFRSLADMQSAPLVVAAAGNESRRGVDPRFKIAASLPAAAEGVISVAALGQAADGFMIAPFSNTMARVSAPGVRVLSARLGGQGYCTMDGTSMACPHVAGVAALWWDALVQGGREPSPTIVETSLLSSCRFEGLGTGAANRADVGEGLVQAPTRPARQ